MARRVVGPFSPKSDTIGPNAAPDLILPPTPSGPTLRANLAFALPFAFLIKAFRGTPEGLITCFAAAGLLVLAAWLTREGVKGQAAYDARKVARRPALPRKMLGSALTGLGMALGGFAGGQAVFVLTGFALLAAGLHLASFGFDPLKSKGMAGQDLFQTDRVARAVTEGEALLVAMSDAILRARDTALEARVARFCDIARALFRQVENDPGDLTAARKFMSVYLTGARDATAKFADIFAASRDPKARADYEALLSDLETNFAARTNALLSNSHSDLDIEIQVLRDRLKLERPVP
jgi:hypothetical protein